MSLPDDYIHADVMAGQDIRCLYSLPLVWPNPLLLTLCVHQEAKVNQSGEQIQENLAHSGSASLLVQRDVVQALQVQTILPNI